MQLRLARPRAAWVAPAVLALAVGVALEASAAEFAIPPLAEPGKTAGYVRGELIYPLEAKPTPQCHASTIVATPSGLVAAWFGGTHERATDVGIWVSRREGGSWSGPVEVVNGSEGEAKEFPCWNPVLFQAQDGPLMLFYKVGPNPRAWWGMLLTSADAGKTWAAPRRLGSNPRLGSGNPNLIGPVKNKPIQLADGAILCGSSTEHDGWRVHFEITRDLGQTWQVVGPINDGATFGAIQPTLLRHPGGAVQVLCRTKQNVLTQAWSADNGATWGPMTATPLPNPNAGVDAVTLADGRHLLVYNHTTRQTQPAGREMLNVAISADGKGWTPVLTLERQKGEHSYPAVIQTADGKVHATYTYHRRTVKHVVLDPSAIKG